MGHGRVHDSARVKSSTEDVEGSEKCSIKFSRQSIGVRALISCHCDLEGIFIQTSRTEPSWRHVTGRLQWAGAGRAQYGGSFSHGEDYRILSYLFWSFFSTLCMGTNVPFWLWYLLSKFLSLFYPRPGYMYHNPQLVSTSHHLISDLLNPPHSPDYVEPLKITSKPRYLKSKHYYCSDKPISLQTNRK